MPMKMIKLPMVELDVYSGARCMFTLTAAFPQSLRSTNMAA